MLGLFDPREVGKRTQSLIWAGDRGTAFPQPLLWGLLCLPPFVILATCLDGANMGLTTNQVHLPTEMNSQPAASGSPSQAQLEVDNALYRQLVDQYLFQHANPATEDQFLAHPVTPTPTAKSQPPAHPNPEGGDALSVLAVDDPTARPLQGGGPTTVANVAPAVPTDQTTNMLKDAVSEPGAGATLAMWEVAVGKADEEKRLIYSVVYRPGLSDDGRVDAGAVDTQRDVMRGDEIEAMAHGWMMKSRRYDLQHAQVLKGDKVVPVESYIAPADFDWETPRGPKHIYKGSWILVSKVLDDELWGQVKAGLIGAYSIAGKGIRKPVQPG